ncbi:MAG TPA: hypothetical protein VJR26_08390 [Candidatus Acidoferrales bacterium]|nr:hypothetical protein [Candidatus Acidoferrales bacterium]
MKMRAIPRLAAMAGMLATGWPITAQTAGATHKITVTFDYDFTRTPACRAEIKRDCVKQFNVYEVGPGIKILAKLMSIPVPRGAHDVVKGLSGTTRWLTIEPGKHLIAVTAQTPEGAESDLRLCRVWVLIPQ